MLLDDDLHMDEGLTLVLCQTVKVTRENQMRLVILDFADISIDFYPKEGTEFTATAPVFK